MKTRVYYGEYTLQHWIDLILKENIKLPDYQRSFVWKEKGVERLLQSLQQEKFIPPVTIARYATNHGNNENLILDGQQRLTSILLAYLGLFPDRTKFKESDLNATEQEAGSDDDVSDLNIEEKAIEWTFRLVVSELKGITTRAGLKEKLLATGKYFQSDFLKDFKDNFFTNRYLGFSYVVPDSKDQKEVRREFSELFRNVNFFGQSLSPLESRRSLYYMVPEYRNYFDGLDEHDEDILCEIGIIEHFQVCKLDIVRYLSILSQYQAVGCNEKKVLVGYSTNPARELYYADYVSFILKMDQEERATKFNGFDFQQLFPKSEWKERYTKVKKYITEMRPYLDLEKDKAFKSWIDADYWLFGLIYKVVFMNQDITNISGLAQELKTMITPKRVNERYSKIPNRLSFIRERLAQSIEIYGKY